VGAAFSKVRPGFASLCRQCGKCVSACPQHIDIPAALSGVKRELEGPLFPLMRAAIGAFERFDRRRSMKVNRR
jgi:predicted aldo/keto reductase-like oxidoreductase